MNLKDIAVPIDILDGQATAYFIPYSTMKTVPLMKDFEQLVPPIMNDEGQSVPAWTTADNAFILCECSLVALELNDTAGPHAKGVAYYVASRNGSMAKNYEAFNAAVSSKAQVALIHAYRDTRDEEFDAAPALKPVGENADPEAEGGTT